jgi:hypothetical protein
MEYGTIRLQGDFSDEKSNGKKEHEGDEDFLEP